MQYAISVKVVPYNAEEICGGLGVWDGAAEAGSCEAGVGDVCSDAHDKRESVKAIVNTNILTLKRTFIGLLLVIFRPRHRQKRSPQDYAILPCMVRHMEITHP